MKDSTINTFDTANSNAMLCVVNIFKINLFCQK